MFIGFKVLDVFAPVRSDMTLHSYGAPVLLQRKVINMLLLRSKVR